MSRPIRHLVLLAIVLPLVASERVSAQTCEGSAKSATTETRHFNCANPARALVWQLSIACLDGCGKVWFTPAAQPGAVDGSCGGNGTFCTPPYARKDYNQGLYAETTAHPTQYHFAEGCKRLSQVITSGNCPCAPECGAQEPTDPAIQGCPPNSGCGSPIVIDLDRGGFIFTDTSAGVFFDLDGDGLGERIAWLPDGTDDGWLALDRNGNGKIDNGSELFGNFTPQPTCEEPHGYRALAVFDDQAQGGDGDGAITVADAIFSALRVWVDSDGDGVSQPRELFPLALLGIRAVDLDYVRSERRDRHGNRLRYKGSVQLARGTTESVDVFLLQD